MCVVLCVCFVLGQRSRTTDFPAYGVERKLPRKQKIPGGAVQCSLVTVIFFKNKFRSTIYLDTPYLHKCQKSICLYNCSRSQAEEEGEEEEGKRWF